MTWTGYSVRRPVDLTEVGRLCMSRNGRKSRLFIVKEDSCVKCGYNIVPITGTVPVRVPMYHIFKTVTFTVIPLTGSRLKGPLCMYINK